MGRKQTPEHIAKRIRKGEDHHSWVGATVSVKGGRTRALRKYPASGCESCGAPKAERHHVDGDTANNEPGNIRMLCRRCHMTEDGRLGQIAALASARSPELIAAAAAEKRARTTCKRDHPLSGDNLYLTPDGKRVCKSCRAIHKKRYLEAKNAGA